MHDQLRRFAGRDAAKLHQQVRGTPARRFAHHARRVRSRGIELAHDRDAPVGVGFRKIAQKILDDTLRPAVHADRLQRRLLRQLEIGGIAIHARGRAEYQRRHAGLAHHLDQRQRPADVDVVIRERPRFGLRDAFERRAMDDRRDRMIVKGRAQSCLVADVGGDAGDRPSRESFQAAADRGRAVVEIVEDNGRETVARQLHDDVGSEKSGAAGDENGLGHGPNATRFAPQSGNPHSARFPRVSYSATKKAGEARLS